MEKNKSNNKDYGSKNKGPETKESGKGGGRVHLKESKKMSGAIKESGRKRIVSIKNSAEMAGHLAGAKMTDHIEGGEYIEGAGEIGRIGTKPIRKASIKSKDRIKELARNRSGVAKRNLARENAKKLAKKKARESARNKARMASKKAAKYSSKKAAKGTVKFARREVAKESTKLAIKSGPAVAGSAAGPSGAFIGYLAGKGVGIKIDKADMKRTKKFRMLQFFRDKLKPGEEQKDNLLKLMGDMVKLRAIFAIKTVISLLLPIVGLLLLIVTTVGAIVALVVSVAYNSPLSFLLPPLTTGETVMDVTSAYEADFNRGINDLINNHTDADEGRKVYVGYEGIGAEPRNYYDIICVYMVQYGYENTASDMNDTNKANLKSVFDDMCSYSTETVTEKRKEGKKEKEVKILQVNITLKSYKDMETEYEMGDDQIEMLESLMEQIKKSTPQSSASGNLAMSDVRGLITDAEKRSFTDRISDENVKKTVFFALSKVGYPYSQPMRDSGTHFDCSSLAYYSWKEGGIDISCNGSNTAAAEANWCYDSKKTVDESDLQPGDLIFYSFQNNGRFKNISHVGIYVGNGKMVEALDESSGVVICNYHNKGMVMIGRPNKKVEKRR